MLKDLQVTLYDIFGYLIPGLVSLIAIIVLFWALVIPQAAFPLPLSDEDGVNWLAVLVGAYIVGHLTQAIANWVTKLFPSTERKVLSAEGEGDLPAALIESVTSKVSSMTQIPPEDVEPELLYEVCGETVAQSGETGDRDLYIYREGFYRGLAVACAMLFLALVVRMLVPGTALNLSGTLQPLNIYMVLFVASLSLIGAVLSFGRYRRFGRYRVNQAVIGFLVLQEMKREEEAKQSSKKGKEE